MKKPIHQVAEDILRVSKFPMTASEIYAEIKAKNLYEFKAKNPESVLRSQLRRHSCNIEIANQAKSRSLILGEDGRFSLA